jgi:hypothetical protein
MKIALLAVLLTIAIVHGLPGDGIEGCDGHESRFTLSEQLPELAASVPNGKKYTYGNSH